MVENLQKLYNTMILVETKGNSTKTMADCLRFIEKMIVEAEQIEQKTELVEESVKKETEPVEAEVVE